MYGTFYKVCSWLVLFILFFSIANTTLITITNGNLKCHFENPIFFQENRTIAKFEGQEGLFFKKRKTTIKIHCKYVHDSPRNNNYI